MEKIHALGNEKIGKLISRFFWPAFISVFVSALYNIVDRIFIGQGVGSEALSGLSIIFPIMLIMIAFGMLFGVGTGVMVSIHLGQKKLAEAEKTLGNGFMLMLIVSLFITLLIYLIKEPLLLIFGATPETLGYAREYLDIILPGTIFQVVGFSLNNVIRSEGNAKVAMVTMLISAGLNLVLDPIFIFVLGMGVKGAAWATFISMVFMSLWVMWYFFSGKSLVKFRVQNMKLEYRVVRMIVAIGMAPFAMQLAASIVHALYNVQLVRYGNDIAVAANGIILSVTQIIINCIIALNMAMQPIIGFNFGAKSFDRVKTTLVQGIKLATLISVIGNIIVLVFPEAIVKLFNHNDPELLTIGARGMRMALFTVFLVGFQMVVGNYFQSTGKAKLAIVISLLRQVIVLIPLLILLPHFWGLDGVWLSMSVSVVFSAFVVIYYLRREWSRINELIDSSEKLL
jgi:putative MATE family efflux protein